MCGIAGFVGERFAIKNVMNVLKRLEYRGYDSSGIAYTQNDDINVIKSLGNLKNLGSEISEDAMPNTAIGHTRWATHGKPSVLNAHPHVDMYANIALVHNGIIENYQQIKDELIQNGIKFVSQTDTEVIAQLIGFEVQKIVDQGAKINTFKFMCVLSSVVSRLKGSFAFVCICKGLEGIIFFAKNGSPLVLGKGQKGVCIGSDENAIKPLCDAVCRVQDNELGYIDQDINIFDTSLQKREVKFTLSKADIDDFCLTGFSSFLDKEIDEGVKSALKTVKRLNKELKDIFKKQIVHKNTNIHITACGTALHAGRIFGYLVESELRIPVSIDFASEFKYKKPILNENSVCFFISQSGETADTIGCVELAKECGATTIGITNVKGSRLDALVDYSIYTYAGLEISVASTKAFLAQLGAVYALVSFMAKSLSKSITYSMQDLVRILLKLKNKKFPHLHKYIKLIKAQNSIYFVGRGLDYFLAMEGALKLKEICYIHCEAFAGGELKHGPLALISNKSVVIAVLTQRHLIDKMLNNIHELNSRGAKVILFSPFTKLRKEVYGFVKLPLSKDVICPFGAIKPLQELTLYTAQRKGVDPDKPRNLAKSVTVE